MIYLNICNFIFSYEGTGNMLESTCGKRVNSDYNLTEIEWIRKFHMLNKAVSHMKPLKLTKNRATDARTYLVYWWDYTGFFLTEGWVNYLQSKASFYDIIDVYNIDEYKKESILPFTNNEIFRASFLKAVATVLAFIRLTVIFCLKILSNVIHVTPSVGSSEI